MNKNCNTDMIISYITLRKLIGYGGIFLPFICMGGAALIQGKCVQESVSMYYYTNMRDFFIGLMAIVSVFLITYKGYCPVDKWITTASGVAGLVLALCPCMQSKATEADPVGILMLKQGTSEYVHITSAAIFFTLLALNSIFLFTRSDIEWKKFRLPKKIRNCIYIACGVIIIASLIMLAVLINKFGGNYVTAHKIPLKLEIIMLFAFGLSWLVKGGTMFKDRQEKPA